MTDPTPADAPVVPATAVPAAAVPAADYAVAPVTTDAPRRSRGLGRFALILGLLAFFGDLVLIVVGIVQLVSLFSGFDVSQLFTSATLAAAAGFFALAFIVFWAGIVVGGLAVLLGLIAAITDRGRAPGIVGLIFGLLVLITHIGIGLSILGAGSGISNLGT